MVRYASMAAALALAGCMAQDSTEAPAASARAEGEVAYQGIRFDTSEGSFTAVLYPQAAPKTVERYLEYVDTGYFVGRSFTRVIPGFVIQMTECGTASLNRDSRTLPLEVKKKLHFGAGALGIARAASPNSGGAEFFVTDFAAGHLWKEYTVFGQVVEGMDVVRRSARVQAIDFTAGGQVPAAVGDRCAVQPVEIQAASRVTVNLPAELAAQLPLVTAERVRVASEITTVNGTRVQPKTVVYNLEWPANLTAGQESELTFYITVYDPDFVTPDAQDVTVSIAGGAPMTVQGDPTAEGIYHLRWTPPAAGVFEAVLSASGSALATLKAEVK